MKVEVGQTIPDWVMPSVSAARMRTMAAILRDPNPVHWDPSVVEGLGYGRHTINQGPLGLSYMVNMLHAWTGVGSIRNLYMTFPKVVLDGDHITAQGVVTDIRDEGGEVIAVCDIWLLRDDGDKPLQGTAEVCVPG